MIKLVRVDNRLLHGQVAFAWTNSVQADCILIANDDVASDELRKTTVKLAKPAGTKLVIKSIKDSIEALNSGVTDKYKLFIVVESIEDVARLAESVEQIKSINLGATRKMDDTERLGKTVHITAEDKERLKKLLQAKIELEIRQVPSDQTLYVKDMI